MLTPPGYRRRLNADVERWAGAGLISRSSADAIMAEYRAEPSLAVTTALAYVLAILAAAGLIALVAANWQQIPREARVAGLLAVNLAVLGVCFYFSVKRETGSIAIESSAALSVMSGAASISLIGQIYHFPSNWPGFALAMMAVAGATALIARSTACLWLAAAAQIAYHGAHLTERGGGFFSPSFARNFGGGGWTQDDVIFVGFSAVLIGLAISRWTARSGPWTIFVAVLPLFWWLDSQTVFFYAGRSLVWGAAGITVATILARELRDSERFEAAVSALVGLFAIGIALASLNGFMAIAGTWPRGLSLGVPAWQGWIAIGAAAVLAIAATARPYRDRLALYWLAATIAMPFVANKFLPPSYTQTISALDGFIRLGLIVLLPLTLLAVEARISERRKTFAFVIAALLVILSYHLWSTKELLVLSGVLLAASAALAAVLLARKTFTVRPTSPPQPLAEGAA